MGTDKNNSSDKTSWFDGLKSEFRKIVWPDRDSVTKQTIAVVAVSLVAGVLIAVIDTAVKYGIDFLIGL